jgi:hypothetical protein
MECFNGLNGLQTLSLYSIPLEYSILKGITSLESALPRDGHMLLARCQDLSLFGHLL